MASIVVLAWMVGGCSNKPEWDPQSVHVPDVTLPSAECAELTAAVYANAETVHDLLGQYEQALLVGTRSDVQAAYDDLMAMRDQASHTGHAYRRGCHSGDETADTSRLTNLAIIEIHINCVETLAAEGLDCRSL